MIIRRGEAADLAAVAAIQSSSPEAGQWDVGEYPRYDFEVAESGGAVAGFAVSRALGAGEWELLNLAVAPFFRRRGVARGLLERLLERCPGAVWLEVRESNVAARKFYEIMGFQESGRRPGYYRAPDEAAIVMKFHSC
jgi:[ribosomal protein S18]-alanine N-acetyltransferase